MPSPPTTVGTVRSDAARSDSFGRMWRDGFRRATQASNWRSLPREPNQESPMPAPSVELRPFAGEYVIAKLPVTTASLAPELLGMHPDGKIVSITRTPQELSIVCPIDLAPVDAEIDGPWTALYAGGPISFGLTGVVTSLVAPLSAAGCTVFVVSTFDGDILMVPSQKAADARELLAAAGHTVSSGALPGVDPEHSQPDPGHHHHPSALHPGQRDDPGGSPRHSGVLAGAKEHGQRPWKVLNKRSGPVTVSALIRGFAPPLLPSEGCH